MKTKYILFFLTTIHINNVLSSENQTIEGNISIAIDRRIVRAPEILNKVIQSYNNLPCSMYNDLSLKVQISLKPNIGTNFLIKWQEFYNPKWNNWQLLTFRPTQVYPPIVDFLAKRGILANVYIILYIPIYAFANADGSFKQDGSITIKTTYGETWTLKLDESFANNNLKEMLNEYENSSSCSIQ